MILSDVFLYRKKEGDSLTIFRRKNCRYMYFPINAIILGMESFLWEAFNMNWKKIMAGMFLIVAGVILLLNMAGIVTFTWGDLWTIGLFIAGIVFHVIFFASSPQKKRAWVLVPGGILLVLSIVFLFNELTDWKFAGATWPFYLLAVALGLFEFWFFGERDFEMLIPITLLTGMGIIFLFEKLADYPIKQFWPILLIFMGVYIIFWNMDTKDKREKI
jgi:hypothetical protein